MNKKLKAKWVKALRSGDYPQDGGQLCSNVGFCCLGVLAFVVDPDKKTWDGKDGCFGAEGESGSVTSMVYGDLDKQRELIGTPLPDEVVERLTELNDGDIVRGVPAKSFKYIAGWIERSKRI